MARWPRASTTFGVGHTQGVRQSERTAAMGALVVGRVRWQRIQKEHGRRIGGARPRGAWTQDSCKHDNIRNTRAYMAQQGCSGEGIVAARRRDENECGRLSAGARGVMGHIGANISDSIRGEM